MAGGSTPNGSDRASLATDRRSPPSADAGGDAGAPSPGASGRGSSGRLSVTLVKLGGSLITDKTKPRTVRKERLERLAVEIAAGWSGGGLIVGHGSGSFGHPEAKAAGLVGGAGGRRLDTAADRMGIARTQAAAQTLHRLIVSSLVDAGVPAYSQPPSGFLVTGDGQPHGPPPEPLAAALRLGMAPVTMGDVAMDRRRGAAIVSTETGFEFLAGALPALGIEVRRVLWLGVTPGVLDEAGLPIPRIDRTNIEAASAAAGGSPAVDVTGGMEHRLITAWRLARAGIESLIIDGREPGLLQSALRDPGGVAEGVGTLVCADRGARSSPA